MTARLTRRPDGAARLRALLDSGQTIVAPGAFDPLAARLVEEAGFPAVYMTGFGTSAALIGRPDVGLLTMTEMAASAAPDSLSRVLGLGGSSSLIMRRISPYAASLTRLWESGVLPVSSS